MKTSINKSEETPLAPVSTTVVETSGANTRPGAPAPKAPKRDKIFSKSRDIREDRGERQMKTMHHTQTFPHAH